MLNDVRIQVHDAIAVVFVIDNDPSIRAALEDLVGSVDLVVRCDRSNEDARCAPRGCFN